MNDAGHIGVDATAIFHRADFAHHMPTVLPAVSATSQLSSAAVVTILPAVAARAAAISKMKLSRCAASHAVETRCPFIFAPKHTLSINVIDGGCSLIRRRTRLSSAAGATKALQ
jgi:hypothetical protein